MQTESRKQRGGGLFCATSACELIVERTVL